MAMISDFTDVNKVDDKKDSVSITTAGDVIKVMRYSDEEKIIRFNNLVDKGISYIRSGTLSKLEVIVPYLFFGDNIADIQFIIDAGYKVSRDENGNQYWLASIISETSFDEIPTADEVAKIFKTPDERRKQLFKTEVELALSMNVTPFAVILTKDQFGYDPDDLQFIEDLGYSIIEISDESISGWVVTIPKVLLDDQFNNTIRALVEECKLNTSKETKEWRSQPHHPLQKE